MMELIEKKNLLNFLERQIEFERKMFETQYKEASTWNTPDETAVNVLEAVRDAVSSMAVIHVSDTNP